MHQSEAAGRSPARGRDERLDTLKSVIFPARHAGIVAIALVLPFVPGLDEHRWWLELLVLFVLLPVDLLAARWTRRHDAFPKWMPFANQVIAAAVVLLAPSAFGAVALLVLADNSLTALMFGRRFALMTTTFGALVLGTASVIADAHVDGLLVAFIISSAATSWIIGVLGEQERGVEELLRERATHDPLTGLPNRSLFGDRLEQALREGRRSGDPVALLLLDLDDFKEVNDALGHQAGDRLLVAFADRLRDEVRDCDTIARLGGDEFALLLTTDADSTGALAVARRVLEITERPFDIDGLELQTRASIGVALHPDHASEGPALSARADVAMYLAKRSRRGVELYEPELDRSSVRRLSLLAHLRGAIATDQLELEFQPSFDLKTGNLVAVEALVRWDHPEHGRIGPDDFIRLAEMSGLIQPLSRWVIGAATVAVTRSAPALQVSANLSARNLLEPDLVDWLASLVAEHALQPGQLLLELTESEVMDDIEAASAVLRRIADLGIGIAIDDFGTGQSALAYLRSLPVEELKLDRSLVAGVGSDDDVAAICTAVVDLAHRLQLRVVAEGVTDAADVRALRQMSCDRAQGFYLGAPVAAAKLGDLIGASIGDALANS